jgi:hypothetical protein
MAEAENQNARMESLEENQGADEEPHEAWGLPQPGLPMLGCWRMPKSSVPRATIANKRLAARGLAPAFEQLAKR